MELPDIPFNKAEYIETASGNRLHTNLKCYKYLKEFENSSAK